MAMTTATTTTSPTDVGGNCKHTNGSESPTPPPPESASRIEESRDQRLSPKESSSLNGSHHKNDSNNNPKPSEEKSKSAHQDYDNEETKTTSQEASSGRTSFDRDEAAVAVKKEDEGMDVESTLVRPKTALDEVPKSSFAAEFINNIRNSRNLLGNSHNELADEIAGKNKEVSARDRFFLKITTTF